MNQVSDVLYPECHLDSPIVTGKLVELLLYSDLPCNQQLEDDTLIRNINLNKRRGKRSPLIIAQNQFRDNLDNCKINRRKLNHIPYPNGNKELFNIYDHSICAKLMNIMKISHSSYAKISERLLFLQDHVELKIGANSKGLINTESRNYNRNSMRTLHLKFEGSKWFKSFLFWFAIKTDMRDLIKNSARSSITQKYDCLVYNVKNYFIQMNRNLLMILEKQTNNCHFLTIEMVLMFCDVLEGRLMIDVSMSSDYRFISFNERGNALWNFIDNLFVDLGNQTYNIVAMIEPLTLGFLQLHDNSPILKGAFLKYALEEIIDEFKNAGFNSQEDLQNILDTIFKIFKTDDIHMIAEFFSFFRTFGHPTLEASNAAKKVREHMNKSKVVSFKILMKTHALFCGFIINGFRERHGGSWPPLHLPKHASKNIVNISKNNEILTDTDCINEWKSFVGIKFDCFMPLILDDDLTMYMKDKALAALRGEWDSVYPKEGMIYNPPPQTHPRRLIEVFLDDSEFDPVNLINYVINGDYLRDQDFNLSYSLKEKEIKQVGRLFAKMTYKMRACQVLAESLIANGVGKYFKENGMAKDEHELLKTLHKLSVSSVPKDNKVNTKSENLDRRKNSNNIRNSILSDMSSIGNETVKGNSLQYRSSRQNSANINQFVHNKQTSDIQYEVISTFLTTDLQKFCLNWRQETSNIFAERLNEIYGLPGFFNWMHKRLEKSVLYVADPHCPPYTDHHIDLNDVENDQIFIKYPMGGIEGYCQKLWTIITIPILFLSAHEVGARIAAVVQGDNQAIAITRRVHPNLPYRIKKIKSTQLAQKYFNQLRINMHGIGHNLKANETILSNHFFIYSKHIYYDGVVLSQALKPMSRVVFWSETIVDETRSACSNISTAISKSIEQGFDRWLGYSLNIIKTLQQLMISLQYTINPNMTQDITDPLVRNQSWLLGAALIPSQLGGFNYMNMCRLYVRNIGDPTTASIADVKRMIKVKLLHDDIIQKIMFQQPGDSTFLDWSSDPYSINKPESQSVTVILKNVTARTILQNSDNPMLRGLFHFDFEQEDRDLAEFLMDRSVIIPRAAHEIMGNSLTGARQEIAGMLDTTKGLIRNSIRMGGIRPKLVDKLALYDYHQFYIFNNLMRVTKTSELIDSDACSVHLAVNLRKRMWFHLARGRPIYGLEVPDIIELCNGYFVNDCEDCYFCAAQNNEYCWLFVPRNCELDSVSKESNTMRVPYFGSTTDERSEIKLSTVKSPSKALRAAIRISTVYTWAFGDTDLSWYEAWYLASFRANVTIEELKAITPISTSNNIGHRLRDKSTQMKYSGSALYRVSRYTVISNDNLNIIIDGAKIDTNIVYQQVMLIGLSILEDKFRFSRYTPKNNTLLHLHMNTKCCVVEMNDHPYIESQSILPVLQKVDCNKLIYDDNPLLEVEHSKIYQQIFRATDLDFPMWDFEQLNTSLAQSLSLTVLEIITKDNRDHLSMFKVLSNDDDVHSLITEFLLVNPETFSLYLGLAIAINWAYDIYYRRPAGKYQMLDFLNTILIPSSKSNLTVLVNAISHPSVFERFWNRGLIEPAYGPNLNQQDFTQLILEYLVNCYLIYINFWLDDGECEYMITESDEKIVDQRFEIAQSRHLCFLSCLYLSKNEMPVIRGLTSIEKCAILKERLTTVRDRESRYLEWNIDDLKVGIYPASLTYIRRGTVKHIKLRQYLSADAIGYERLEQVNSQPRIFEVLNRISDQSDGESFYFPALSLFSQDFTDLDYHIDSMANKNRWEIHIRRRIGVNSTSCYKAVEMSNYINTILPTNSRRLFIGEGSGSMMAAYYFTLGEAENYYNTGVSESTAIGQRMLMVSPSEYYLVGKNNPDYSKMIGNLTVLFNGKPESTWIGNIQSFQYIMNNIKPFSVDMIHSDMESTHSKDTATILREQIHVLTLAVNLGSISSILVTKLAPRYNDYSSSFIRLCTEFYSKVVAFFPSMSNPYSSEFYLICSQKRVHTITSPDIIYKKWEYLHQYDDADLTNVILNLKIKNNMATIKHKRYYKDYLDSDLDSLSKVEKVLVSIGFKVNGPKMIKMLTGHDISTGEPNLIAAINVYYNHILNLSDPNRDIVPFFEPYPLEEYSKIREMYYMLTKRIIIYLIVYGTDRFHKQRYYAIQNLRRKVLSVDYSSSYIKGILQSYLLKRAKSLKMKDNWSFEISTQEIKTWWKIVGYSLLLLERSEDDL